jgi:iron complex outermembrane receptor protein
MRTPNGVHGRLAALVAGIDALKGETVIIKKGSRLPRIHVLASSLSVAIGGAAIAPAAGAQEAASLEEIVVTGSRIARRDFTASSPIVTVGAESFENISTVGVESALNMLPQFQPAGTQFDDTDVQASAFNSPGISSVNLRGLGANRNLVLINGRRAQPANATLVVDVNSIPSAAIQTVEVITGGASAVYGADAVGGVVNFILKDDFEGLSIDMQTSSTFEGDGEETRFSVLMGTNSGDDRANVMLGLEWADRKPVYNEDREFIVAGWDDPRTTSAAFVRTSAYVPLANPPSALALQQVLPGAPGNQRSNEYFFNPDGTVFKQAGALGYTGPVGSGTPFKINAFNGNLMDVERIGFVQSPLTRYSAFGSAHYDISDNVTAIAQANFASWKVDQVLGLSPGVEFWSASIPRGANHPVPAELQTLLDSRADPNANWQLRRVFDWSPPRSSFNTNSMYQLLVGVEGRLPGNDWTWEGYVSQGRTTVLSELDGFVSVSRWREIVQAPNYGVNYLRANRELGYRISCTSGLPIFSVFTPTQDCIDSMTVRMKTTTDIEQKIAEFNIQGGIVEMGNDELAFAAGVSYRENSFAFRPDLLNDNESIVDFPAGLFSANPGEGATDVAEVYGELLVPIVDRFSLELGARSSDYNTVGRVETYKALFDWEATDRIRVRGGRQLANRAPNTAELFVGETQVVVGFTGGDPCVSSEAPGIPAAALNRWGNVASNPNRAQVQQLCSALINEPSSQFDQSPGTFSGSGQFFPLELERRVGDPTLNVEEATTYTLGVVWSGDRINTSVDVYDVDIQDAIGPLPAYTVYQLCFNADSVSNPSYSVSHPMCQLITRQPGSGQRLAVQAPYRNLGFIKTTGVDIQFNWRGDVGANSMYVNTLVNYVDSYETQDTTASPIVESVGTLNQGGQFEWTMFTTLGYDFADLGVGLRWQHLPSAKAAAFAQNPLTTTLGVEGYEMFDFFGNWTISERVALRFGVDNLLDEDPEIVNQVPNTNGALGSTLPDYYDILGRRAYVGVRWNF